MPLRAANESDFMDFMEAIDSSISSYDIKLHKAHFYIEISDYEKFTNEIEKLRDINTNDVNLLQITDEFISEWCDDIMWTEKQYLQNNELFKESSSSEEGSKGDIKVYDGQIYRKYSKHNEQLDIYPDIPPIAHTNFESLGITTKGLLENYNLDSFRESKEGYDCTFSLKEDEFRITNYEYDKSLRRLRSHTKINNKSVLDNRWLFYNEIDNYSIPGVKFDINIFKERCSVYCYVIEKVDINCRMEDKDFDINYNEIPPWALVIDHRQEPYTVEQLVDYPNIILRDEVMLNDLTDQQIINDEYATNIPNVTETIQITENKSEKTTQTLSEDKISQKVVAKNNHFTLIVLSAAIIFVIVCVVIVKRITNLSH